MGEVKMASFNTGDNTDMFSDIDIQLYIELGRVKIKISDLLNLSNGSVVHLEQKFDDPLIIYANDRAIAKGQIISSNGKFNIQILNILGENQAKALSESSRS